MVIPLTGKDTLQSCVPPKIVIVETQQRQVAIELCWVHRSKFSVFSRGWQHFDSDQHLICL